ncbi:MAG TPA: Ldh family oxidoreductase [Candidatus Baltobacteraceae bacterium]|nr:Ldh family oxidoreductase [Candidatus Baltobacteraceae bacterium]
MPLVRADGLTALLTQAFQRMGARPDDAGLVAASLVKSNLSDYPSHGVYRVEQYYEWWRQGLINTKARPVIAEERGFAVQVDGNQAFGQVVANFAVQTALRKARSTGIAIVTARSCNHIGRLADYAEQLKEARLIGIVMANDSGAGQVVAPWGGIDGRLSTNPIAIGIPGEQSGILFDFSTSAAAAGKVKQLLLENRPAPDGWLIDASGTPTREPAALFRQPRGFLLPAGGHRGYALSLVVEVMAGILSGAGFAGPRPGPEEMNGVFVQALDPGWFVPPEMFYAQVDQLGRHIKSSRPMPGVGPVHIPGERAEAVAAQRRREGIPLDTTTYATIQKILRSLSLPDTLPVV